MSKRFFTILIAAAAAGFLSCNKVNPTPENSQDPTPSGETVVLTAPQLTASPAEVTIDQAELEVTSLTLSWTDAVPQAAAPWGGR